jgi:hypothetical protein
MQLLVLLAYLLDFLLLVVFDLTYMALQLVNLLLFLLSMSSPLLSQMNQFSLAVRLRLF